ncbi:aldehyde dehydrogenase family protein [Brevibacterium marinum]|uniref:Succinate-semialdehyde dehydrogenase/glutarate-semialdehyde dehydrogenase n=1 Tax=Brevibacterium marinum TaxID=418643 RepID=A0A846RXF7_9MICO|nr:aldehyde dehydrogenase family protein [Brevibacterium marinum]NJC55578.1 succinate-semialdehyde dehydrogenase/glutarate-semialdehyde dehydrogenase [Brevibacterium marinum]
MTDETDTRTLQNFIDGAWTGSFDDTLLPVVNPATQETIARFPRGSGADVDRAVAAALRAQAEWSALSVEDRVARILRWADRIEEHTDELAELECREMGKPVDIGRRFIAAGVAGLRASAQEGLSYSFETSTDDPGGGRTQVIRHPVGVAAVVTPWNFPVTMVLAALGPVLASGNTVVVKPSERSPLSTVRLFELLDLPAGVLNLVLGDVHAGEPLVAHDDIDLVHFTGSVAAGRKVGAAAGRSLHRAVLELGGKDPVIVDDDVDVRSTAEAVAFGSFVNTGQICTSMERIYVHEAIAEEFVEELVRASEAYAYDDGLKSGAMMGPLVDGRQRDIVHSQVTDAVSRGATVRTGGRIPDGTGYFYPATVITGVEDSMPLMTEETFGPVAPVAVVSSFAEGVRRASRSAFGLALTVYSHTTEHLEAAKTIPAGVIWVNQWQGGGGAATYEPARASGMGATGATASYDAATRPSTVHTAAASS